MTNLRFIVRRLDGVVALAFMLGKLSLEIFLSIRHALHGR
jgi:hypothetical protein